MPELPEVELAARRLREQLLGRRIEAVEVLDPKLLVGASPRELDEALVGQAVRAVERRAKHLLLRLSGDRTLLVHLRMTGRFVYGPRPDGPLAHPHRLALSLDGGEWAVFRDPSRFGRFRLCADDELERLPELAALGPDALLEPPGAGALADLARGRRRSIKALLMDQRRIGGLGNICAVEILFRAGIAPWRPAGELSVGEIERIARLIPEYLCWAIERQERRTPIYLGERAAENVFSLYRRAGQPCPRCATPIERTVVAGRGTFYCPGCQPDLEGRSQAMQNAKCNMKNAK